jgi:hypothetical protein
MLKLDIKIEGLDKVKKLLDPKKVDKAVVSTLNEVAKSTKTEAWRRIGSAKFGGKWKIKQKDLNKRLKIKKARRGDMVAVLTARRISGRDSIPLPYFGAKEIRKLTAGAITTYRSKHGGLAAKRQKRTKAPAGVSVQVQRGGKVARYPGAFIARMKSGHIGVFRSVKDGNRWRIREVKTVSVVSMFAGVTDELIKHARGKWNKRFPSKLEHELKKGT